MEHVLDAAQERAMSMFESGLNVALLGRAGSEKSVVLREMVRRAVGRWGVAGAVAVTALSGSAAVSVGGQTVHSLFGWDVRPMSKQDALELVRNRPRMFDKLNRIRVLFVDVAPTMSASLFSEMAHVMRHVAPANLQGLPFGDCQLICAGDVLQAGPVKVTDRTSESWVFSCPDWRLALHGQHGRVACITVGHR
ncbi:hypothetical protein BU14_0079s0002 [Porphyra umbilicalis]|uniref:ATP-dependent DNA helicase n=1 Tax=Porphyra umbilicalis TaxID=2786 RepID=A0A1X6PES9_PORUM|nr:hypothetical protein BU14_0079s0002 [Porphyra umbilicalis]|eukprot:OSX79359.1 hypothetical protein BU14_0079s0002 [Porphyra umbilicalis]